MTILTQATAWVVERADGVRLGFTDHDRALSVDGVVCEAASGLSGSEARTALGFGADAQDVEGAFASDAIRESDVVAGHFDGARVHVWRVDWRTGDARLERTAVLGEVSREGTDGQGRFRAELRGLSSLLDQSVSRRFNRRCDADLGDRRCGASLVPVSTTVAQAIDAVTLRLSDLGDHPDDHFAHGRLLMRSGENKGVSVEVAASLGAEVSLWQALPLAVAAGDAVEVAAGCDKTFATCRAKFDNHLNFRGFPHMPGDGALTYAAPNTDGVVHDGSPLVELFDD